MKKAVKAFGLLFVLLLCAIHLLPSVQLFSSLPDEIYLRKGASRTLDLGLPVQVDVESTGVVSIAGQTLAEATGERQLTIQSVDSGETTISLSLFGVPVKTVKVNVSDDVMVIPGGQSIGVTLYTKGALVVGITGIQLEGGEVVNPAREAGMLPGDVILSINGTEVNDADHVSEIVENTAGTLKIVVDRAGREMTLSIDPVTDFSDGKKRLGIWVRDSTAGVGTLTFISTGNDHWFAGLGHAICDIDTGSILTVREGEIYFSEVIQVHRGENGAPGEIKGYFSSASGMMGLIQQNCEYGIYGPLYEDVDMTKFSDPIPVASRDEVKLGAATILATIDGEGVKEFDCEIIKLNPQASPEQKGIVLRVTDPELLEVTGGIVQGMSGSPILQNGKLVGAVTHVFVNNPTKGYGLYVDWMLDQIEQ